jgi:hypothetical protein
MRPARNGATSALLDGYARSTGLLAQLNGRVDS